MQWPGQVYDLWQTCVLEKWPFDINQVIGWNCAYMSWRHVFNILDFLKWDRVHSMIPPQWEYSILKKSLEWAHKYHECEVWRKFTVPMHLFCSHIMRCVSSLQRAILTAILSLSAHWHFCVSCYKVHSILQIGQSILTKPG